jgi:hypothetical protein
VVAWRLRGASSSGVASFARCYLGSPSGGSAILCSGCCGDEGAMTLCSGSIAMTGGGCVSGSASSGYRGGFVVRAYDGSVAKHVCAVASDIS